MTIIAEQRTAESDCHREYVRRLEARRGEKDRLTRLHYRIGNSRVALFGLGGVVAWMAFGGGWISGWWLLAPLLVFVGLIIWHDRILQQRQKVEREVAFYENGLLRLEDRWIGRGVQGTRFANPSHSYTGDLDIFGRGSLFELLCTARTQAGEECLAEWLQAPATPEIVRERQKAVAELRSRLDLREELAVLGEETRSAIRPETLIEWGEAEPHAASPQIRLLAAGLASCSFLCLMLWALLQNPAPFYAAITVGMIFTGTQFKRVKRVLLTVDQPARDLSLLSALLARLERETFQAPLLQRLSAEIHREGRPPSARIAHLQTLQSWLDARRNILFVPIDLAFLWTVQFAFAIEAWRVENGPQLGRWLRVIGEFETLFALAGYAWEHPADPFPDIMDQDLCFQAEGLGHPLLPIAQTVCNDVRLDRQSRLLLVSGSNMSGKSTLLRTIGTNTVLALAGAPVRAGALRLTPIHLGASIRTQDSLQGGISRFYAEILRLRQIVDIARDSPPLLFLLDEILHGTNSHDRRVGAEAVIRSLIERGAIGLVTTHDLALTRIVEDPALHAVNVHFEDHLEDGKMTFDYRLHPGVVTKSNAIELMRAVGLEV